MERLIFALAALMTTSPSYSACSDAIVGRTATVVIDISDGGCAYEGVHHITFWQLQPNGEKPPGAPVLHFPFEEECFFTKKGGFTCKRDGRTPLAGATYKKTMNGYDRCDETGKQRTEQYECIAGCNKPSVPRILSVSPYEC